VKTCENPGHDEGSTKRRDLDGLENDVCCLLAMNCFFFFPIFRHPELRPKIS
jgi:hypothetical protein